jgi:hypothetical protein
MTLTETQQRTAAWEKVGLIFRPDPSSEWMRTHACCPVPMQIEEDVLRVWYAGRDARNRSHVGSFDIDMRDRRVIRVAERPVLAPGPLGNFDDHGIYASCVVPDGGRILMYTIGWNPGVRQPLFYASIGLAISEDGGQTFERYSPAPVLARSRFDPCTVTGPMVRKENGLFRMWYVSGYRWDEIDGVPRSWYHIKYAESPDGIEWKRDGVVAIEHATPDEKNIGRPFVRLDEGIYRAWYGYSRGEGYRIGYAESTDGVTFTRHDDRAGIAGTPGGSDGAMLAHPHVLTWRDQELMFYNGDGFGKEGVLLAVRPAQQLG